MEALKLKDIPGLIWRGSCTDGQNITQGNLGKGSYSIDWGTFDLRVFNGKVLQEGANIQEYREFLRSLETTRE